MMQADGINVETIRLAYTSSQKWLEIGVFVDVLLLK